MSDYRQFAEDFAYTAGKIIKENFSLGMAKEWKSDNTPVTVTDKAINSLLIQEIQKKFPEHSILAEEESALLRDAEYVWVCDPIDGTIPFCHGVPTSTFSLALTKHGESILGVVYDPFLDRLFVGEKGKGTTLNNKKVTVSTRNEFKGSAANYEMGGSAGFNIMPLVEHLVMERGVKLFKFNSYIYPSVLIAAGEFVFTIFPSKTAHDAAAVKVIVEEAGGIVTDLHGNDQRYDQPINGLIASNGMMHDELVQLAKKFIIPIRPDQEK